MRTLIANGHIVTAIAEYAGDILIEAEKIVAIGVPGAFAALQVDTILDAQGRYIFPGAIDVHTHMELPLPTTVACDDFESGTIAAACGGTTTILILPTSSAVTRSPKHYRPGTPGQMARPSSTMAFTSPLQILRLPPKVPWTK